MRFSEFVSGPTVLTLAGLVVTVLVGELYFLLAGRQLRNEAADLKHLSEMVLRALENAGFAQLNRDASGRVTGLVLAALASGSMQSAGSVHAERLESEK